MRAFSKLYFFRIFFNFFASNKSCGLPDDSLFFINSLIPRKFTSRSPFFLEHDFYRFIKTNTIDIVNNINSKRGDTKLNDISGIKK